MAALALLCAACEPPPGQDLPLSKQLNGRYLLKASDLGRALAAGGLYWINWPDDKSPMKPEIDYAAENFLAGIERLELIPGRTGRRFEIHTNSHGFRGDPGTGDFDWKKPAGVIRIAVMGDSSVFGVPVAGDETFSAVLERELTRRFPGRRFEVLNLGIPGMTMKKLIRLYEALGQLEADFVLFGSAFNDYGVIPHPDRAALPDPLPVPEHGWRIARAGQPLPALPPAFQADAADTFRNWGPWKWLPDASRPLYGERLATLTGMIRARSAVPMMLNLEQPRRFYRPVMERMADELAVPLLQIPDWLLDGAIAEAAPRDPGAAICPFEPLPPAPSGVSGTVRLLVRLKDAPEFRSAKSYSVAIHRLGDDELKSAPSAPWTTPPIALNDSGKDGDEKPGDGIFSVELDVPVGETLQFYFLPDAQAPLTDEIRLGRKSWPARFLLTYPRDFARYHRQCDPPGRYATPVYRYGHWDLMEEPVHPSAKGHELIGRKIADFLEGMKEFRARTGVQH